MKLINKFLKWRINKAELEILHLSSLSEDYRLKAAKELEQGNTNRGNKILEMYFIIGELIDKQKIKISNLSKHLTN